MKRVIVIVLSLLVLLPVFASCAETEGPGETTTTSGSGVEETSSQYVQDNIGTKNFNTTIKMLHWNAENQEFFSDEQDGTNVNDAIFARNLAVETRLGIEFDFVETKGAYNDQANFLNVAMTDFEGPATYDIYAGYSMTAATFAINGLTANLNEYSEELELDKPWWPDTLISQATINDKLFFVSGDISTNMIHMMYGCFFNKGLFKSLGYEDNMLYDLVDSHDWTLDKLIELSTGVYSNTNIEVAGKDYDDRFGFGVSDINSDAFFTSVGLKTVEKGEDGKLVMSPDFRSSKTQYVLETVTRFYSTNDAYAPASYGSGQSSVRQFANNQLLFTIDRVNIPSKDAFATVSESFKYGVLPCPLFDYLQENYVTMLGFPYTMYSVSAKSHDLTATVTTLNCLGSESYRRVTPELFEITMRVRYANGENDSDMFDRIRDNVYIDLGRLFTSTFNNYTYGLFRNCLKGRTDPGAWASTYDSALPVMNSALDTINKLYFGV